LPTQEEFENLCFFAAGQRVCELWLFVIMLKRSYAIDLSLMILLWFIVKKGVKRKNFKSLDSLIHGKQIETLYIVAFVSYSGFESACHLFSLYLLHKLIFLLLLL